MYPFPSITCKDKQGIHGMIAQKLKQMSEHHNKATLAKPLVWIWRGATVPVWSNNVKQEHQSIIVFFAILLVATVSVMQKSHA